ncbi:MspA family porin [Gordonia sp. CPCC 205515]|uniref:MspA family porin n=1 Tax=Gordonia sp. CPCC 205515 TaxID=3140791 RepID=UPI003AF332A1
MKKINKRLAATAGAAGAVVIGLTSLGAGGAAAGPIPSKTLSKTLMDGTKVTVTLTGMNVNYQRAVTNVQTSREVWGSAKVGVKVGGKADGGTIKVGYQVGCQVTFTAGAGSGAGVEGAPSDSGGVSVTPSADANAGVTLGPGQVQTVWIINTTSGDSTAYKNYNVNDYTFKGNSGGVAFSQEKFGVDGCAGYAQGRVIASVTVNTDSVKGVVGIASAPFSLG